MTTRWEQLAGPDSGTKYQRRFDALAASGQDMHGEARFVATRLAPGSAVLDAGCGTGRVAIRLHELGYAVAGVDVDASMLAVAAERAPHLPWVHSDLAALSLDGPGPFDAVVLAGNVIPLLGPGTLDAAVGAVTAHVAAGGVIIAGFGLDAGHLPTGCPVTPLAAYDLACSRAGLELADRFGTWDGTPFLDDGYAVSVHQRCASSGSG